MSDTPCRRSTAVRAGGVSGVSGEIDGDEVVGAGRVEPTKTKRFHIVRARRELESEEDGPIAVR